MIKFQIALAGIKWKLFILKCRIRNYVEDFNKPLSKRQRAIKAFNNPSPEAYKLASLLNNKPN